MFGTAARISEAIAVRWGDIDLSNASVRIVMGKVGGKERFANLQPKLIAALANIPCERRAEDRVFPYASYRACADPWEVAIRRAGIKRLTPHSCRHGFATSMLHAGVDPVTVAETGGWADVSQVFKTYGHAMKDRTVTNVLFGTPKANATLPMGQVFDKKSRNG
jgi:integrase